MIYDANTIIKFGRHKGRILEDVICGVTSGSEDSTVENYLIDLFDFLSNDVFEMSVNASQYILDDKFNNFLKNDLKLNVSDRAFSNLKIISDIIIISRTISQYQHLKSFLINLLEGPFNIKTVHKSNSHENSCLSSLSIKPDTSYISWAIKNVKDFIVDPEFLCQEFQCGTIENVSIVPFEYKNNDFLYFIESEGYLNKDRLMRFETVIKMQPFVFSNEIKEINKNKLKPESSYFPDEPTKYGSNYSQYGGPHFDGCDLDDDFINDALGGDPNNYWNIS